MKHTTQELVGECLHRFDGDFSNLTTPCLAKAHGWRLLALYVVTILVIRSSLRHQGNTELLRSTMSLEVFYVSVSEKHATIIISDLMTYNNMVIISLHSLHSILRN